MDEVHSCCHQVWGQAVIVPRALHEDSYRQWPLQHIQLKSHLCNRAENEKSVAKDQSLPGTDRARGAERDTGMGLEVACDLSCTEGRKEGQREAVRKEERMDRQHYPMQLQGWSQ